MNGFIKIEEVKVNRFSIYSEKKYLIKERKDYLLKKTKKGEKPEGLNIPEAVILKELLPGSRKKVLLSWLKDRNFSSEIKKITIKELAQKKLIFKKGMSLKSWFSDIAFVIILVFFLTQEPHISILLSAFIMFAFSFFMLKRKRKGTEVLWKIKGFKMYMDIAEKYRQRFYENENIFEKLLPYAIVFGIAKHWNQKMKEVYRDNYFVRHVPTWYVETASQKFDFKNFNSAIENISSRIAASIDKKSGFRGGDPL